MVKKIVVTEDDIRLGHKGHCWFCPVNFACERAFNLRCTTNPTRLLVKGATVIVYRLPPAAIEFIRDFDAGRSVSPLEFIIESPE